MSISNGANEFVRHVGYELNRREHVASNAVTPGARDWEKALNHLCAGLGTSPVKQAKAIERVARILKAVPENDCAYYIVSDHCRGRNAALDMLRVTLSDHPLRRMKSESGMLVYMDLFRCSRSNGRTCTLLGLETAYVSNHALGRLYERGMYDTYGKAINIGVYCGLLGIVLRMADQHHKGEVNLRLNDVILTGVLIHAQKRVEGLSKECLDGTYIDFRTCIPYDESHPKRREQADRSAEVVNKMLEKDVDGETFETIASRIPYIPRREDSYVFSSIANPAA